MEFAGHWLEELAVWVKLAFEIASILVVAVGGLTTLWSLFAGSGAGGWLITMRSGLSRYLLVALELQLASDIVGTAISPTLEQLGSLAAIAVIRTFLSYFLVSELRDEANIDA